MPGFSRNIINTFLSAILFTNIINAKTNTNSCMVPIPSCGSLKINLPKEWNTKVTDDKLVVLVNHLSSCDSDSNFGTTYEFSYRVD